MTTTNLLPPFTQTRLLDAAERLFADRGFHGVALRELTRVAGVNLAAVNYHFGDMATVYREVLLRRIRPLNARRLRLLHEACEQAGAQPPAQTEVWRALALPLFELHRDETQGGRTFGLLLVRALTEPRSTGDTLIADEYHPVLARFAQQIRRYAIHLTPEDFMWRFSFVLGALHHALATLPQMTALTKGICRSDDHEGALARFIAHATAAFAAEPTRSQGLPGQHPS